LSRSSMLIVCPNCATSYRVKPSSLGGTGRSVRCVRCRNVWFARDPSALDAITPGPSRHIETLAAPIRPAAIHNGRSAHGLDALIHDVIAKPFTLATTRSAVNSALGAGAAWATI
jgi:predicted Zn finger-like uncharacterized protein